MRQDYFKKLESLYGELQQQLPKACGNPCGSCFHCCTTSELTEHRLTALELDFIEDRVGGERIGDFKKFLGREKGLTCPFYDQGCTIYEVRPYSCRTFGHFRREDTPLPEVCVFRGQEEIFGVREAQQRLPLSEELTRMSRDYWAHRVQRSDNVSVYQAAGLQPDLASAFDLLDEGQLEEAVAVAVNHRDQDPFSLYCKSFVCEMAGELELAEELALAALKQAPDCADLWSRLGAVQITLQRYEWARTSLERCVLLHPADADGWGLLGMLNLKDERPAQALDCLERAVALTPHKAVYQQWLEVARNGLAESV